MFRDLTNYFIFLIKENRFTKCDTCSIIKAEKEKTMDKSRINELNQLLEEHNKLQMLVDNLVVMQTLTWAIIIILQIDL